MHICYTRGARSLSYIKTSNVTLDLLLPNSMIYYKFLSACHLIIIFTFTLQFDGNLVGNHDNLLPCTPVN